MNYLKKTLTTLTSSSLKVDHPHGADFEAKRVRFFEMQNILNKLGKDLKLYHKLWGELLAVKTQIFGYIMLFYQSHMEKYNLIDELFRYHQRPFELMVRTLSDQYEHRVIMELEEILKMFPTTDTHLRQLKTLKLEWMTKQRMLEELKRTNKRYPNYAQLTMLDETCRKLRQEYIKRKKVLNRELDQKIADKGSMLDRFVIQMLSADYNMYIGLANTADVLKTQAMAFYQYRQYPRGYPAEYHDPPPTESGSLTSDSELESDESMITTDKNQDTEKDIAQSVTSPATTLMWNELNDSFDLEPDEISTILSGVGESEEKTTTSTSSILNDSSDTLSKSQMTLLHDTALPALIEDKESNQSNSALQTTSSLMDPIETNEPSTMSVLDLKEDIDTNQDILLNPATSLPPAPRAPDILQRKIDLVDNNSINGPNIKEWWESKKRKKDDNTPLPVYYYCKSYHPLGIGAKQLNNFRYVHKLFDPRNTFHYSEKHSNEILSPINPSSIPAHMLLKKAVNMQNLEGNN